MQRLLPVTPASRSFCFSLIAVIPRALAAYPQRLVPGEERTLECVPVKLTLNVRYHGICSGAIDPLLSFVPPPAMSDVQRLRPFKFAAGKAALCYTAVIHKNRRCNCVKQGAI